MERIYADSYEFEVREEGEQALYDEVLKMEKNSRWIPGITSKDIKVMGLENAPLFAESEEDIPMMTVTEAERYGIDHELANETLSSGTRLILDIGHEFGLMRNTAYSSLCETAKINGSALGRLFEKNQFEFSELMNLALSVARGTSLALVRYGKISALHSSADGGYEVMNISKLLEITVEALNGRFGDARFKEGYNTHGYTSAEWELPDAQSEMLKLYQDAMDKSDSQYAIDFMPSVRFASSDTASSSAILVPQFTRPNGTSFTLVEPIKVKHTRRSTGRNNMSAIEVFEEEANNLWAKFNESAKVIEELSNIIIYHPQNCVISLCKRYKIPKKYGEAARQEVEYLTAGGSGRVTAHDLYLAMTEITAEAARSGASKAVIIALNESVCKMLKADWLEHDVGGIVAWSNAA